MGYENYLVSKYKDVEIDNKPTLKVFTSFSGVGMQERGIEMCPCFDFELVGTCETDINAIISYAAMHNGLTLDMVEDYLDYPSREEMANWLIEKNIGYDFDKKKPFDWQKKIKSKKMDIETCWLACQLNKNVGDISKYENLCDCDLFTFSFPCQSISAAGRQAGIIAGETRSGLVYEVVRLIENAKDNGNLPKYLLLENVKALQSKKFIGDFENLNTLFDDLGYNVYWTVMNAKNTGVPQNRERVFGLYVRKDVDTGKFTFPDPFDSGLRLKDVLQDENEVDDKYYITNPKAQALIDDLVASGKVQMPADDEDDEEL